MNKVYNFQYDHKSRWISYWHQINEILSLAPRSVLEIGIGNKTVSNYLKNQGLKVVTLDADEGLKPDIVASVLKIPSQNNSFDAVLCAEVLEHLPFEDFPKALAEIKRVTRKYVVLSLPHWGLSFYAGLKLPLLKEIEIFIKFPFWKEPKYGKGHCWEIGRRAYSLKKIKKIIKESGFKILKDYLSSESPYHHFFILEK